MKVKVLSTVSREWVEVDTFDSRIVRELDRLVRIQEAKLKEAKKEKAIVT